MTTQEFSNEFDVLYNNIMSNQAPGIDDYEKSVFLTKAQLEILKNYFNPKGNKYQEGFDNSRKRQIDFSNHVIVASPSVYIGSSFTRFNDASTMYSLPSNILFILDERINDSLDGITDSSIVVPIGLNEFMRIMSKPYRRPLRHQVWRLIQGDNRTSFTSDIINNPGFTPQYIAELIGRGTLSDYRIRYVKRPSPIIVADLSSEYGAGISIDGVTAESQCLLDKNLHREILQRAVELAKSSYEGDLNSTLQLGQRSE